MEKKTLKRGAWSYEEDRKLATYVKKYGIWNWNKMPKYAGLSRSGKSCRLRWMNYLRPDVKIGKFTEEEDETIIKMHEKIGNRWSEIARKLPGRTDNEIKNHWHTRLKKRLLSKKTMVNPAEACQDQLIHNNSEGNNSPDIANDDHVAPVSGSLAEEPDLIFWTQPFLMESSAMEYQQFGYGHSLQFDGFGPFESSFFANDICLDVLFSFSETEDILSCI